MTDMTIKAIRTTMLRVPWPNDPWLKGHRFGDARNILVLEAETQGGIVGMGYLLLFRPGIRTIAACLEETIIPRVIGKDASAVEAIWQDLWQATMTYGRGGIAVMAMSALDIALWDAVGKRAKLPLHRLWGHYRSELPTYGIRLLPQQRRRRHDRQGAALQGARLQGDQDAGCPCGQPRRRSR